MILLLKALARVAGYGTPTLLALRTETEVVRGRALWSVGPSTIPHSYFFQKAQLLFSEKRGYFFQRKRGTPPKKILCFFCWDSDPMGLLKLVYYLCMSAVDQLLRVLSSLSVHGTPIEKAPAINTDRRRRRTGMSKPYKNHSSTRTFDSRRTTQNDVAGALANATNKFEFALVAVIALPEWDSDIVLLRRTIGAWVVETGQKKRWSPKLFTSATTDALLHASIDELMSDSTCKVCNGHKVVFKAGWKECPKCAGTGVHSYGRRIRLSKINEALPEGEKVSEHAYRTHWAVPHAALIAHLQHVVSAATSRIRAQLTDHPPSR